MTEEDHEVVAEVWNCTRDEYDADTAWVRSSSLKDFATCPYLFYARHVAQTMPRKELKRQYGLLGGGVHALTLENVQSYRVSGTCGAKLTSGTRKGELCGVSAADYWDKEEQCWVCGKHTRGRDIEIVKDALKPEEHERVLAMAHAIQRDERIAKILSGQNHEIALRSVCRETGVRKKALVDVMRLKPFQIVDVKTTEQFQSDPLWRKFDDHGWGLSLAHYESVIRDVAAHENGSDPGPAAWAFIVIESVPPYRVQMWPEGGVDSSVQETFRKEHRDLLYELAECQASDHWPQRPLVDSVPQWFAFRHGYYQNMSR